MRPYLSFPFFYVLSATLSSLSTPDLSVDEIETKILISGVDFLTERTICVCFRSTILFIHKQLIDLTWVNIFVCEYMEKNSEIWPYNKNGTWKNGPRKNGPRKMVAEKNGPREKRSPEKWFPENWFPENWSPEKFPSKIFLRQKNAREFERLFYFYEFIPLNTQKNVCRWRQDPIWVQIWLYIFKLVHYP